ncbi:MAG: hypothetical protein NZ750_03880 [Anaerolineae bacterium]|nr:hypothetical protein [Anaerolineae bacterium]MDW8171461.1 hypothetical protein [Anaerolineae bacterium]
MPTPPHNRRTLVSLFLATLALAMTVGLLLPSARLEAQSPTATPTDPLWLAFSSIRRAIEVEEKVDLRFVQKWEFYQDDWSMANPNHPQRAGGIDSCVSTVIITEARPIFFGWTFVITALNGKVYTGRVAFNLRDLAVCDIAGASGAPVAAPPPAAGAPVAGLPTPVAGAAATGRFELGGHVDGLPQWAVDGMKQAGMTWVKKQIRMENGLGAAQALISDAKSKGFKILLGIVGNRDSIGANPSGYYQQYASFVAEVARAGADAIEVWNEPNIDREWPANLINGAEYTKMLAAAYNAIKSANPNVLVISGAPAPTGFFGAAGCGSGGCNDDAFMQQMARAGAAQFMDCVGLHYNEGIISPSANSGDPRDNYPTRYFNGMNARAKAAFPNKPLCYTELGYLSGEGMGAPIPSGFAWANGVTVAQQAAWLAEAASIAAQRGDIRLMIVWNVNFTRWDSDPMGGYAIFRPGGACPACATLGTVMRR